MRLNGIIFLVPALALAGCSSEGNPRDEADAGLALVRSSGAPQNQFGFMESMNQGSMFLGESAQAAARSAAVSARADAIDLPSTEEIPAEASQPSQIAYNYSYGFRVDPDNLETLQQRHVTLCESMAKNCRILSLARSGNDDFGYGTLHMQVAAEQINAFSGQLTASTEGVHAEQISHAISGEDLTDAISDTQAHLEGRRLLRDRLMEILRTRQGSVGDLVKAERGVAEVNEEIDSATSRLANMRNRVVYSDVQIEYDPTLGQYRIGFSTPVNAALGAIGTTLGVTIAGIIYVAVALVPILTFLFGLRWLWRKSGLRLRRQKQETEPTE